MAEPATATSDVAADLLRSAGLRVTAPRCAVLVWLDEHPHSTVHEVSAGVRHRLGSISTQAVYDVLDACTRAGLLRRIEPAGHPARFERRVGDDHHHLVCRQCGRTEDVDRVIGNQACLATPSDKVFAADEIEVVFWGVCSHCATSGRSRSAHPAKEGNAPYQGRTEE
jgi:Fur family transcriptional regulator, stress-responsive regulator